MVEVCYSNQLDEEASSTTSDDFIVVSKVFDLNTPLDEDEIRRRLQSYNSTNNGVVLPETRSDDKLVPSAFSMHVEQLKLEQQQQKSDQSSSSDDDGENSEEEEEENSTERYFY